MDKKQPYIIDVNADWYQAILKSWENRFQPDYNRFNYEPLLPLLPDSIAGYSFPDIKKLEMLNESDDVFLDNEDTIMITFQRQEGTLYLVNTYEQTEHQVLIDECSFASKEELATRKPLRIDVQTADFLSYFNQDVKSAIITDDMFAAVPDRILDLYLGDHAKDDLLYYGTLYTNNGLISIVSNSGYLIHESLETTEKRLIREQECYFGPKIIRKLDKPEEQIFLCGLEGSPPHELRCATMEFREFTGVPFDPRLFGILHLPDVINGIAIKDADKVTLLLEGQVYLPEGRRLELDSKMEKLYSYYPSPDQPGILIKELVTLDQVADLDNQAGVTPETTYRFPVESEAYQEFKKEAKEAGNVDGIPKEVLHNFFDGFPRQIHGYKLSLSEKFDLFLNDKIINGPTYHYKMHPITGTIFCQRLDHKNDDATTLIVSSITLDDCGMSPGKYLNIPKSRSRPNDKGMEI